MIPISAVIITLNEARNIERCIVSLQEVADEIVVVDSFSTDSTAEICKQYGVNFVQSEWKGYAATKNEANALAHHQWILSIDADEALSETLKQSIILWKQSAKPVWAKFNRLTNYCGTWVRHCGWYPDVKLRLFDRQHARWQGTIHETLEADSKVEKVKLEGDLLHYSFYTQDAHRQQVEKYSALAAQEDAKKYRALLPAAEYFAAISKFVELYFFKLGFLDGHTGFTICKISAWGAYLRKRKVRELLLSEGR